jgi:tetratricopeptide (TPR) repeat protein
MSTTLNLVDRLLKRGRSLQEMGRSQDALHTFERLAHFQEIPSEVAEETQVRLAELQLQRRQFKLARRHLTAVLRHYPDNGDAHYLLATALETDDKGDPRRALAHYRRCLEVDGEQPDCLCACGMLALRLGRRDEGLAHLRRAVELLPDDPETFGQVVTGLCLANEADEARRLLLAARFRNPHDARFVQLWNDFQFQRLRKEQESAANRRKAEGDAAGPVVLPFTRPEGPRLGRKKVRQDAPAPLPAPHVPRRARLSGQRHAQ